MKRTNLIVLVLVVLIAVGAFWVTALAQPASEPVASPRVTAMMRWLQLNDEQSSQITAADPAFDTDAAAMQAEVQTERAALAKLLESADVTDEQILAQIDRVNVAEHALERRVISYLLKVREHLTAEQRLKLMGLAADCVRGRGRGGEGRGLGLGPPEGRGPAWRRNGETSE